MTTAQMEKFWFDGQQMMVQRIPEESIYKREWVGLTDEEFNDAISYKLTPRCIAIAIEAKLKEKNT